MGMMVEALPIPITMKLKITTALCVSILGLSGSTPALATAADEAAFFDAVLGRPVGFAATVIGGAVFVVSLPLTATSGSIRPAAKQLVGRPARFTFTRRLGDFSYPHQRGQENPAIQKEMSRRVAKPVRSAQAAKPL